MTGAVPVMLNDISVIQLRDAGSAVLAEVPLDRQGASSPGASRAASYHGDGS